MADQSVRIENLPDSGSRFAISLELTKMVLHNAAVAGERREVYTEDNILRVYRKCAETVGY